MHQANSPLRRIVVVGGGAAGWLTASIIAVTHKHDDNISVTLVESPDVSILGVGEGTWPTMRSTLLKIGISEETFLAQCNASFKQGTSFHNWRSDTIEHQYYHPFSLPFRYFESDVAAWWQSYAAEQDFAHAVCSQAALCDHHLAPKQRQTPAYAGIANYGYHLDANKFAALLQKHATTVLGVQHIVDHVDDVVGSSSEPIAAIVGREHGNITGDLFIDCTGFAARLIGQHYGVPLTSCSNVLANDSAIAIQAPYIDSSVDIASTTHSTAQDSGWIWDIGLPSRKGVGYVYSSAHCSEDEARATLETYLKHDKKTADVDVSKARKITFSPGYRKTLWVENCVAIGTSAGFLEPLEASALVMIELSATHIAKQLPRTYKECQAAGRQFNQAFEKKWERIVDFLKLHYVLSEREASAYWRDMRNQESCSTQLQDWLTLWKSRSPISSDFELREELFPAASYLFVLYGMGFRSQYNDVYQANLHTPEQRHAYAKHVQSIQQQLSGLPTNRQFLNQVAQSQGLSMHY